MVLVSKPYILTSACRMALVSEPYIGLLTSACRMVLVSDPYVLASAYRMVQGSKPVEILTLPSLLGKINYEHWRQDETHLAPYTTEVTHCWRCHVDPMYYVWYAVWISVLRLFCLEIRSPRIIRDSINDVSIHIDWCIKWSSSKILNLGFLSGSIHSKRSEATWKLESIIDNRSPSFLGSHRDDILHIRLYKVYSMDCCWGRSKKPSRELLKKTGSKCHINYFAWSIHLQLHTVSVGALSMWTCLLLSISIWNLSDVSFVAEKTHPII